MRVLHVLDHSIPLHSGYTFRTRAILREQRRLGWETHHLTSPKHAAGVPEEDVDGLHFHRTPWRPSGLARLPVLHELALMRATARRLADVAERVRPDLIHAHSPVLNALPALWVGRRRHIPMIYEVRACWEDAAVDHGSTTERSLRYRITRGLETAVLRRADAVTVICEGLRREFVGRGVPAAKITVIPNAVEIDHFGFGLADDPALRAQFGLDGATVLGFVGSFYAYEGLDLLLRAFCRLQSSRPDMRLLLVGGGPQEPALRALAAELGVLARVTFAGRVSHDDVQRYYGLIDVLAYPRYSMRLTELVTPLKPLEAMAQGSIFVASDVGGHRELVCHGKTGFLFAAGSVEALATAIDGALVRRAEWDDMRRRARRFVEVERTWVLSVARYAAVYEQLLQRRSLLAGPTAAEH